MVFQSADVTLKMRSVSPKSNHFFPLPVMCLCKFGQNPPTGSGDKSADKKQCRRRRRQDPHQKQYPPPHLRPLRLRGHKYADVRTLHV